MLGEGSYLAPGFLKEHPHVLQFGDLRLRHLSIGASFSFVIEEVYSNIGSFPLFTQVPGETVW